LPAPTNGVLGSTPDVLFERVASDFAAPHARLVRAHEGYFLRRGDVFGVGLLIRGRFTAARLSLSISRMS
jgi:hypothetical protein